MNIQRPTTISTLLISLLSLLAAPAAFADWHQGKITGISFGYDGASIVLSLSGWTRSNCTCYSPWPSGMCLTRSRPTHKEEFAFVLKARAMDETVNINIDETTCAIVALWEGA